MKSLLVASVFLLVACNDPYSRKLPPIAEWEQNKDFQQAVQKLPEKDRELLAAYYLRHTVGGLFNGGTKAPPLGVTIRAAVDDQRKFLDEEARREAEQKALAERARQEREAKQKLLHDALTVAVTSLQYRPSDWEQRRISDDFVIRIAFQNKTDRSISGVKGAVHFTDQFGDEIFTSGLKVSDSIAPRGTLEWVGTIDYNQFKESHQKLRSTPLEKMKIRWDPDQIVFEDGAKLAVPDAKERESL